VNHLPQRRPQEKSLRNDYHGVRLCEIEVVLSEGIALFFEHHDYRHHLSSSSRACAAPIMTRQFDDAHRLSRFLSNVLRARPAEIICTVAVLPGLFRLTFACRGIGDVFRAPRGSRGCS
jgi:hypothetical protein